MVRHVLGRSPLLPRDEVLPLPVSVQGVRRHDALLGKRRLPDRANVDHRERPELVSRDDRFAYAFTSFALSYFPSRIWHFDRGRLIDVTRRFPTEVAGDATGHWRSYVKLRQERLDVRGVLAAWLADQYQRGRGRRAGRSSRTPIAPAS